MLELQSNRLRFFHLANGMARKKNLDNLSQRYYTLPC